MALSTSNVAKGFDFPIAITGDGHFATAVGADKVRANILALVKTKVGERFMATTIGMSAYSFLLRDGVNRNATLLRRFVLESLLKGIDPKLAKITNCTVDIDVGNSQFTVNVDYVTAAGQEGTASATIS